MREGSTKQRMKSVYFISGLGADKRAFSFFNLSFCNPVFIDWIVPETSETMATYANRLRAIILEKAPIVVGLSFGGMLVTEMAKADGSIKAILISSNKKASEFPFWLRVGKYFPVYKWVPDFLYTFCSLITLCFLGAKGKEEREVLRKVLADTDIHFTKWAIEAIMNWDSKIVPSNITNIHGTADKLLPHRFLKANYTIVDGEHLMVMDKSEEISAVLRRIITG